MLKTKYVRLTLIAVQDFPPNFGWSRYLTLYQQNSDMIRLVRVGNEKCHTLVTTLAAK